MADFQLALPGMGAHKPLSKGGRSPDALPSRMLSKLQFSFDQPGLYGTERNYGGQRSYRDRNEVIAKPRPGYEHVLKGGETEALTDPDQAGYLGWASHAREDLVLTRPTKNNPTADPEGGWHSRFQKQPGGEINYIETHPNVRGAGVATHMWDYAHEQVAALQRPKQMQGQKALFNYRAKRPIPPVHSPTRTDAGEAWSAKVGGFRPPRRNA